MKIPWYALSNSEFNALAQATVSRRSGAEAVFMKKLIGFALLMMGFAGVACAGGGAAPEIDPSSALGAVTLLAGGVLVIRGRRRKR